LKLGDHSLFLSSFLQYTSRTFFLHERVVPKAKNGLDQFSWSEDSELVGAESLLNVMKGLKKAKGGNPWLF
jgi:hypothetical protein